MKQTLRRATYSSAVALLTLALHADAHAKGCEEAIYHFAFRDWKSQGTGWVARPADFSNAPKGVSIFVDLSATEYGAMNQERANALEVTSVLLRVMCSDVPKGLSITEAPTNQDNWTQEGGAKHAVINSTKKNFDYEDFNQDFKHKLINVSSSWQTATPEE